MQRQGLIYAGMVVELTEIIDEALLFSNDFNYLSDKDKFDASETLHKLTKQQGEHERWITSQAFSQTSS